MTFGIKHSVVPIILAGLLVAGSAAVVGNQGLAHSPEKFSAGEPGNPKRSSRVIAVTLTEQDGKMLFKPSRIVVRRGEQIRFVLQNTGVVVHEFMIATPEENKKHAVLMQKYPEMEHDDPNGKTLKPKERNELLWHFTKAGEFEFACLIPGHYESGMFGKIVVR